MRITWRGNIDLHIEKFKRFYYENEDIIPKTYLILDNAS